MIKLPHLTWNLDCGPMGYPGLTFVLWLNPPVLAEGAEVDTRHKGAPPWEDPIYRLLARVIDAVCVPAEYSDSGKPEELEIGGDARALYELERGAGFDPQLVIWVSRRYREERVRRLDAELKN